MNAASVDSVDVVGVGLNATDTIIRLPYFPAADSKVEVRSSEVKAGGQVASAIVACRRWGLTTRYVGKVGDDSAGKLQIDEMKREGVDARWIIAQGCASQTSHILVDEASASVRCFGIEIQVSLYVRKICSANGFPEQEHFS